MKQMMNDLMKYKYTATIFYKGTMGPMRIFSEEGLDMMYNLSNDMIKEGLKHGFSLKEQGEDYKNQLDVLENKLYNSETLDQEESLLYWLNVLALIKLKIISNDDMNGINVMKSQ